MLLASRIAWRNEPVLVSFVLMTVKVAAGVGVGVGVGVAPGASSLRPRLAEVERAVLSTLANVEASNIDEIDNSATASVIRSAKARAAVLFFILFFGG
jgi:hypothetical protein